MWWLYDTLPSRKEQKKTSTAAVLGLELFVQGELKHFIIWQARRSVASHAASCTDICMQPARLVAGPGLQPYQQPNLRPLMVSSSLASISWFLSSQLSDPLFLLSIWPRLAATWSLGACASRPVFWLVCLDICYWLCTDICTHTICTPVSPVAGTWPLWSEVQEDLRTHTCTQGKSEKEFNEKTGQAALIRCRVWPGMTNPCLHVISLILPLLSLFSHSFYSPEQLDLLFLPLGMPW